MKQFITIVFFMAVSMVLLGCNAESALLNDIDQYRANKIISTLEFHGIQSTKKASKKGGVYSIIIGSEDLAEATRILSSTGPYTPAHPVQTPCKYKGLIATPSEERSCRKFRLEAGLEDTISQIDGVISTEVHIVMTDKSGNKFKSSFLSSSAAVFIKYQADADLSLFKTNIKRLVEKSIPGLTYDKVSLVLIPARVLQKNRGAFDKKNNVDTSLFIILLGMLLVLSWVAFFFKEAIMQSKVISVLATISFKKRATVKSS